jgi:hypothetical protein
MLMNQRCPWRRCRRPCHDGSGGAAAADCLQNHRGSGAVAAGFLKFIVAAADFF